MRLISAALLGAAATLPSLAHAATTMPDPTDATAPVPAMTVPSAFDGYQPYRDGDGPTWLQLNKAVLDKPAKGGMKHGGAPAQPAGGHSNHAKLEEAAK
ncbi:hypothetical protein WL28_19110 [Burkholderia ubonensis]|uniref:hypothetical protein n=1 Tax=Burkholderia ubonensis TaxID=101571 RepID=UPI0007599CC6|nr:hypothetical protein [Burkholderia ubonensis]KWA68628.1 hypothetical protein WL28_19110 [Burkholderia ubonensis]